MSLKKSTNLHFPYSISSYLFYKCLILNMAQKLGWLFIWSISKGIV